KRKARDLLRGTGIDDTAALVRRASRRADREDLAREAGHDEARLRVWVALAGRRTRVRALGRAGGSPRAGARRPTGRGERQWQSIGFLAVPCGSHYRGKRVGE